MALTSEKQIEELNELIRFDLDAVGVYNEAIDSVKEAVINEPLVRFRADHERHIRELSEVVRRLGGKPPTSPDLKGIARKTMTKVSGLFGVEAVLKAMKSNEEVLNKTYAHHAALDFPNDVINLIRRNLADEERHLQWVDKCLRTRPWEVSTVHP